MPKNRLYPYLRVNDTIQCKDENDLIHTMRGLQRAGISTEFDYSIPDTFRLKVTRIRQARITVQNGIIVEGGVINA